MDSSLAVKATNLSKKYRLGTIGMSSLRDDLSRWWGKKKQNGATKTITNTAEIDQSRMINDSEFWALCDLNFQISKGEVVGLIGANGSGKSTLLKILSQITEPTKGEVKVRGKVASLLEVGTGFHPELTGKENIFINGAILGMSRREVNSKIDEIIEFAGVSKFIDTPIKRYSSGMTVRLGFGIAAHLNSEILIIDEVLAVGDWNFQRKCISKMQEIAKESGRSIIFVSHQMQLIEMLCDSVILLNKGAVNFKGETIDGIEKYLHHTQFNNTNTLKSTRHNPSGISLTNITLTDSNKISRNTFFCGEQFRINLHIRVGKKYQAINPMFMVNIHTHDGIPILCQHNLLMGTSLNRFAKDNIVSCQFIDLSLPESNYTITAMIFDSGTVLDKKENCSQFAIQGGNYLGHGDLPHIKYGPVIVKADWGIE
jgi:lipopolysaccharide transport system ATP-binding protein